MRLLVKGLLLAVFPLLILSQEIYAVGNIVINEFAAVTAGTTTDPDWAELYNVTDNTIDLNGWVLRDSTETNKVNLSGFICPNGFRKVNFSNRLNNGGDTIRLFDASENLEDSITYFSDTIPQHNPGQSTSRVPDGSSTWTVLAQPTPLDNECLPSATPTPTPTETPSPTLTPTLTPIATPTLAPTETPMITVTPTTSVVPTPTITPKPRPFKNWWLNFWRELSQIIPHFPL